MILNLKIFHILVIIENNYKNLKNHLSMVMKTNEEEKIKN